MKLRDLMSNGVSFDEMARVFSTGTPFSLLMPL